MKKLVFCMCLAMAMMSLQAQDKFTIKGNLQGQSEQMKVVLSYTDAGNRKADTVVSKKGAFKFKGTLEQESRPSKATLLMISLEPDNSPWSLEKMLSEDKQEFYIEKGTITVKGNTIKTAKIKAGKTQSDYAQLTAQLKPFQDKMVPIQTKMGKVYEDEAARNALFPQLQAIRSEMSKVEDAFIFQNPDSYVSLDMVEGKSVMIDVVKFEPFLNALSERLRNSTDGKVLAERFALAKKTAIGQPALLFTQNNTEDIPVSLASLKGKYVLIDFWASWCGPCRAENPNVVKAYNKFKNKNFEIIAVSLDDKKDPWLKAIEMDGLPWINVSDLKGWKNEVALDYGVKAVPQNLLLDPNGIIIAKNLRGEELEKQLAELVKN